MSMKILHRTSNIIDFQFLCENGELYMLKLKVMPLINTKLKVILIIGNLLSAESSQSFLQSLRENVIHHEKKKN